MQRVTNMEMLKLSYWNPAKDMRSILVDIKQFLQQWARLEGTSERNDRRRYPYGSYVDIEHHLLRLALVSDFFQSALFATFLVYGVIFVIIVAVCSLYFCGHSLVHDF